VGCINHALRYQNLVVLVDFEPGMVLLDVVSRLAWKLARKLEFGLSRLQMERPWPGPGQPL